MRVPAQEVPGTDPDHDQLALLPGFSAAPVPRPSLSSHPDPAPVMDDRGPGPAAAAGPAAGRGGSGSPVTSTPEFFKQRSKAYASVAKALLLAVGGWLNRATAIDETDESFLPDDDDQDGIPPPLGRMAARRITVGDGEDLSDIQDAMLAGVAVVVWLAKGVTSALNARRERRRLIQGAAVHDEGEPEQ